MAAPPLDTILASKAPAPAGPEHPAWDADIPAWQERLLMDHSHNHHCHGRGA